MRTLDHIFSTLTWDLAGHGSNLIECGPVLFHLFHLFGCPDCADELFMLLSPLCTLLSLGYFWFLLDLQIPLLGDRVLRRDPISRHHWIRRRPLALFITLKSRLRSSKFEYLYRCFFKGWSSDYPGRILLQKPCSTRWINEPPSLRPEWLVPLFGIFRLFWLLNTRLSEGIAS